MRPISAVIVGSGPDEEIFKAQAERLGITRIVDFAGAVPASAAFRLGRILVMPSRAESLPYVALEAAGAGLPLIASHVGGMPEIVEGTDTVLVPPGDAKALGLAMLKALESPIHAADRAGRLHRVIADRFTIGHMTDAVLEFYAAAQQAGAEKTERPAAPAPALLRGDG